jgi:hypothetical protein
MAALNIVRNAKRRMYRPSNGLTERIVAVIAIADRIRARVRAKICSNTPMHSPYAEHAFNFLWFDRCETAEAFWVDLFNPTPEESAKVSAQYGTNIPGNSPRRPALRRRDISTSCAWNARGAMDSRRRFIRECTRGPRSRLLNPSTPSR